MSNTTNPSNMARDAMSEAKEAAKDTRKAAANASGDIQEDLTALRDDVSKLTQQIGDILAARGNAAWQKARSNIGGVISDAEAKGMEAVGAVREVGDNMVDAIDESLKRRPYTTLALAAGIGFLFGATWRR
jgi:ElaB/YqjD/DUF883 family membrane-anchored ribosome-binding protein